MRKLPKLDFDEIDFKIADILREDGRISYRKLGEAVSLSPPSVYERIRKMTEKDVILGYRAEIDFGKFGYGIHAFILLKDDKVFTDAPTYLAGLPYVQNCWMISGEYDYLLEICIENNQELSSVVNELYDNVGRTYTLMIIRDIRQTRRAD